MQKKTKIVCTLGPAVDNEETLRQLLKEGMNCARLNFSHGSHEEQHGRIGKRPFCSKTVAQAAVLTASHLDAKAIVCPTMIGRTALLVSNLRPSRPIYSVTPSKAVARSMQLYWGVTPIIASIDSTNVQDAVAKAETILVERGILESDDVAVVTLGDPATSPRSLADCGTYAPTNVMFVIEVH